MALSEVQGAFASSFDGLRMLPWSLSASQGLSENIIKRLAKNMAWDDPEKRMVMRPYTLKAGEGWTYRYDVDITVKAGELHPGRGATFTEYETRQGEEPPDHKHPTEDEIFYVLKGELTFHCGDESFDLSEGGFIYLPQGHEHGYTIRSMEPARLIIVTFPASAPTRGGWGGFIADVERRGDLIAAPDDQVD